ncbi:MAG: SUMF1/EgtB/PvdO family nonheme iron enzyme [Verrucomicrobiaceae bacterium]|nr:SUMF1/EgtB/PvdO family nonheme iron enzyme [Verrucomicrobiaceae bacterium]
MKTAFFPLLIGTLLLPFALNAGERRALVIGNNSYPAVLGKPETGTFGKLDTCVNDAGVMRDLLAKAGFKLEPEANNLSRAAMVVALTQFAKNLKEGDEALIYFAGHGMEFRKNVYMMGTNALGILDTDLDSEGLSEAAVTEKLAQKKLKLAILILDCCREKAANETFFEDTLVVRSRMKNRSSGNSEDAATVTPPPDILVGYATSGGRLTNDALNKGDKNGPLVVALKKHWDSGKVFELMWKDVSNDVEDASKVSVAAGLAQEIQRPSMYGSTRQNFSFMAPPQQSALVAKMTPSQRITPVSPVSPPVAPSTIPSAGDSMSVTLPGGVAMKFRYCPVGSFTMGSPITEADRSEDEKQVRVTLTQGYWMAETECTQAQWEAVMRTSPSGFSGAQLPVESVSYEDAEAFMEKVNASGVVPAGLRLSLPTEAQWEYACRAGTTTATALGDSLTANQANFDGNYPYGITRKEAYLERTTAVGSYEPNGWGLKDMHGNVYEWCMDSWDGSSSMVGEVDPVSKTGSYRVNRGGSWGSHGQECRSANRQGNPPDSQNIYRGFRPAAVPAGAK